jgi:hypothetical protein
MRETCPKRVPKPLLCGRRFGLVRLSGLGRGRWVKSHALDHVQLVPRRLQPSGCLVPPCLTEALRCGEYDVPCVQLMRATSKADARTRTADPFITSEVTRTLSGEGSAVSCSFLSLANTPESRCVASACDIGATSNQGWRPVAAKAFLSRRRAPGVPRRHPWVAPRYSQESAT